MEKSYDEFAERFRDLEENYKRVSAEVEEAAVKSGRDPREVTLLAATKTVPPPIINRGIELGLTHIGENRVQELCEKYEELNLAGTDLQFIGHLQTNKAAKLIGLVSTVQSVDSIKLAQELSRLCVLRNVSLRVLLEVNIGGEESKSGASPQMLYELLEQTAALPGLRVEGLMAIPPAEASKAQTTAFFSKMYQYFVDIKSKKIDNVNMNVLSMGMSGDYEDAILAGATMVRVGSALFGARLYR